MGRAMNSERILGGLAAAILLTVCAGCLDFEEQKARIEHDQERDRLVIVVNYYGLYDDEADAGSLGEDAKGAVQLKAAMESDSVALFGNWPFEFKLKQMRSDLVEPDDGMKDVPAELRRDALALLERVHLRNAGFYVDPAGRVCGGQVVVIERARESVELFNSVLSRLLLVLAERENASFPDGVLEYARRNHPWLSLKGHSLIVRFPCTEEEFAEHRQDVVDGALEDVREAQADIAIRALEDMLTMPVLFWHEDGMARVKCGLEAKPSVLILKPRTGEYEPNMAEHIQQSYGFHLDDNLARYLLDPDAPAETEEEEAARMMAPRLTKLERVRVLVHQSATRADEQSWALLGQEPPAGGMNIPAEASDAERLELWRQWLASQVPASEQPETVAEP